jgi:hypothetical protein
LKANEAKKGVDAKGGDFKGKYGDMKDTKSVEAKGDMKKGFEGKGKEVYSRRSLKANEAQMFPPYFSVAYSQQFPWDGKKGKGKGGKGPEFDPIEYDMLPEQPEWSFPYKGKGWGQEGKGGGKGW